MKRPKVNRRRAERGGRRAEALAALWLRLKGWAIVARRVRTPRGEVDLVARRGRIIAFVEVEARAPEAAIALSLDDYRPRRAPPPPAPLPPHLLRPRHAVRTHALLLPPPPPPPPPPHPPPPP